MAMMLPGWLTEALQYLGYNWPTSNEDILHANAEAFRDAGREADSIIADIEAALSHIQSNNAGEASEAFLGYMRGDESNLSSLHDFTDASGIIAGGFDGSLRPDGSIEVELQAITGATCELGFNPISAKTW